MGTATRDPGSFRDPSGYVLHYGDAIYRSLDLATFDRLSTFLASPIYRQLIDSSDLLAVTVASDGEREQLARLEQRDDRHYLRQRRLGLISYPTNGHRGCCTLPRNVPCEFNLRWLRMALP
ncbi:MAG TPA: hypothetical protein VN742_07580 [Candidatus Binataceae bacterium]|nr:hypothetical protein [Candidatus Binataceae bacterium]